MPARLHWRVVWFLSYPLARLLLGLRVHGRERLGSGPQILAANHVSNFDPLIVGWAARREVHFLAKDELFRHSRLFAWLIRTWNAWPLRRGAGDAGALKRCSWLLRRRQTLVLFPEGTRSKSGEISKFRPGVGMLAVLNQVPVVPTLIRGMDRSIVSSWVDRDFVRLGLRQRSASSHQPIDVFFGEPVSPVGFGRDRTGYEQMTETIEQRVREMA